ncbi:MAG: hypothetical protein E7559_01085 [Ruminococcaceae bacterium]|nr:hypothetical protein [Oscillospiraceae bacterium]
MKKRAVAAIIIAAVLIIGLCVLASNPIVVRKDGIPTACLEAIESQSKGVYSSTLPLVPIYVAVDRLEGETVYYTIHYFPFGTVGMSYTEADGYNMEKPLTRL